MGLDGESDEDYEVPDELKSYDNIDFDAEQVGESEDEEAESVAGKGALHFLRRESSSRAKVDDRQLALARKKSNDDETMETAAADVDLYMEQQSKQKSRGKKKNIVNMEEMRDTVSNLLNQMEIAADNDYKSNADGKPAIEKLKLLPEVEAMCIRKDLQPLLLSEGILGVLKSWIEPLEDGSLPNIKIRTTVLKILHKLPIDTAEQLDRNNLKMSQIGSRVMLLSRVKQETRENRKIAWNLVQRWCRPIFEQARQEDEEDRQQETLSVRKRRLEAERAEEENRKTLKPGDRGFSYFASRPKPSRLDYVIKPDNPIDPQRLPIQKKNPLIQKISKRRLNNGRPGK